jgi:hypothetical protein
MEGGRVGARVSGERGKAGDFVITIDSLMPVIDVMTWLVPSRHAATYLYVLCSLQPAHA